MKKITLAFISILSLSIMSTAQDFAKYKIGFKLNPNFSWMTPDDNQMTSEATIPRFGFGLVSDIHFTENYAFGTGLNIENAGGTLGFYEQINENDVDYVIYKERTYKTRMIEIPLSLKLRTNEIGYITYWGQFGLGLGMHIEGKADDEVTYEKFYDASGEGGTIGWKDANLSPAKTQNINIQNDINIFRGSLLLAAGIEYNLQGSTSIMAGITYNNGFTNVLQGQGVQRTSSGDPMIEQGGPKKFDLSANNSFIAINLGVMF